MDLAARAETWLRVYAGQLVGPPAPPAGEVDRHGVLVLSSVAHALAVLDVLDPVVVDDVFADLGIAAGIRGRKVAPNAFRSGEGLAYHAPGSGAGPPVPWPPEVLDAGACLRTGEGEVVVQVLWLTRTAAGTWAPARVRLPGLAGARAVVKAAASGTSEYGSLGPGVPPVEVLDDAGGTHHLSWLTAQGDGRHSWGVVRVVPDLPPRARTLTYRFAGDADADAVTVEARPPAPAVTGRCEDDGRTPAERYVEWLGSRRSSSVSTSLDEAAASVRSETCAALRDLGLVRRGHVPAARPRGAGDEGPPAPGMGTSVPVAARPVAATIPLGSAVFVEGVTVDADRAVVYVRQRDAPNPAQPVWWQAVDESGATREAQNAPGWLGGTHGPAGVAISLRDGEKVRELRLVASTPFESAYVELELP